MGCYRVSGTQRVDGHEPDDVFEASYSEAHESYLLAGGHLVLVVDADGQVDGGDEQAAASPQIHEQD